MIEKIYTTKSTYPKYLEPFIEYNIADTANGTRVLIGKLYVAKKG